MKKNILDVPRYIKQIVAIICDLLLCVVSVYVAYYLRLDQFVPLKGPILNAVWISIILALPTFWLTGLYRTIFRYSGLSIIFPVSVAIAGLWTFIFLCFYPLPN
jgi:FlaA1/EpsC-like NDP-sugar epimerase